MFRPGDVWITALVNWMMVDSGNDLSPAGSKTSLDQVGLSLSTGPMGTKFVETLIKKFFQ